MPREPLLPPSSLGPEALGPASCPLPGTPCVSCLPPFHPRTLERHMSSFLRAPAH